MILKVSGYTFVTPFFSPGPSSIHRPKKWRNIPIRFLSSQNRWYVTAGKFSNMIRCVIIVNIKIKYRDIKIKPSINLEYSDLT